MILAFPGPAAVAAQQVTTTVPVVFMIAANPVTLGLVKSLEKPGGNITGLYEELPDFQSKRVALLKEMVPQAKTIGILWDVHSWGERVGSEMARRTEKAVLAAGARAEVVAVKGPDDLERAFSLLKQAQVDGLLVEQSPVFIFQAKKLAELAAEAKLPAIYPLSNYTQVGGFASLGPNLTDNLQHTAGYIGKILKGANPVDLPVESSEKPFLTVNSKAAKDSVLLFRRRFRRALIASSSECRELRPRVSPFKTRDKAAVAVVCIQRVGRIGAEGVIRRSKRTKKASAALPFDARNERATIVRHEDQKSMLACRGYRQVGGLRLRLQSALRADLRRARPRRASSERKHDGRSSWY